MFVYGDVVYAQTWQVSTLKSCIEPFSYASTAYVVASTLISVRLFCKNLSSLQNVFGQMVYRPPLAKNSPYAYAFNDLSLSLVNQRKHNGQLEIKTKFPEYFCLETPLGKIVDS